MIIKINQYIRIIIVLDVQGGVGHGVWSERMCQFKGECFERLKNDLMRVVSSSQTFTVRRRMLKPIDFRDQNQCHHIQTNFIRSFVRTYCF